jgi:nucleoside-diphosphate-sugar epimerase
LRILLTGASGFVGSAVLGALLGQDVETVAVSRTRPPVSGAYQWHDTDLLDHGAVSRLIETVRPDTVLHLAWTVEHGRFWTAPANLDWVGATLHLARAAAANGTTRFIGTGTCYEYDWPATGDCRETGTPLKPALLYGVAKDATRRVLEEFAMAHNLGMAWARLFFLYGPGEGTARLVPSLARALVAGEPARCSSGTVIRDFMDVRDAGRALALLALSDVTGAVNIASGTGTGIADLARMLGRLAARPELVHIGALPDRPGEPPRIVADVTRLTDDVGFRPDHALEAGLGEALVYWGKAGRGDANGK